MQTTRLTVLNWATFSESREQFDYNNYTPQQRNQYAETFFVLVYSGWPTKKHKLLIKFLP